MRVGEGALADRGSGLAGETRRSRHAMEPCLKWSRRSATHCCGCWTKLLGVRHSLNRVIPSKNLLTSSFTHYEIVIAWHHGRQQLCRTGGSWAPDVPANGRWPGPLGVYR